MLDLRAKLILEAQQTETNTMGRGRGRFGRCGLRSMTRPPRIPDPGDVPASLSDQDFEALWDLFEEPLPRAPDPVILRIVRALARQAAREDHARESRD
jgi:hypothetical protein